MPTRRHVRSRDREPTSCGTTQLRTKNLSDCFWPSRVLKRIVVNKSRGEQKTAVQARCTAARTHAQTHTYSERLGGREGGRESGGMCLVNTRQYTLYQRYAELTANRWPVGRSPLPGRTRPGPGTTEPKQLHRFEQRGFFLLSTCLLQLFPCTCADLVGLSLPSHVAAAGTSRWCRAARCV